MFNGLFQKTHKKLSFQDMQYIISNPKEYVIINTLLSNEQHCLIQNTISYQSEEKVINEYINQYDFTPKFVIYGKNTNDETIETKAKQLSGLGFTDVYLYKGGMFEWLLLQDIYGNDEFSTTSKYLDILFYKPISILV
tara:strand:- start:2863 stop:3276 length:414 start_codon:yes stop_codon:yes gene_type:complete